MKKLFIPADTTTNTISYYHLVCFLAALPFHYFYSQLVMISFAIHTFIHLQPRRLRYLISTQVLIQVSIFFAGLLAISYSSDPTEGLRITGRQSAIVFMPVLLMLNPLDLARYAMALLKIFALVISLVIIYLYADAIRTLFYFHLPLKAIFSTAFINHNFSMPIGLHATYLSMYAALSFFVLLVALQQKESGPAKLVYLACLLILFAGILQLTSRAVLATVFVTLPAGILFLRAKRKKQLILFCTMLIVLVGSFFIIGKIDAYKLRYVNELKNDLTQAAINNEILEPRVKRWELAMDYIRKAPLVGHGNGSEKGLMKEAYFRNGLYISYLESFNVHSQYLSFLFRMGILGLLLFLFVLYYAFVAAFKTRDFLFFSFLLLIAVVSVSENILDVNKGVFFYSFFMAFFLMRSNAATVYQGNREPGGYV